MKKSCKLIFGIGFLDADYVVQKRESYRDDGKLKQRLLWICPFYRKWTSMLQRCFDPKLHKKRPTYAGCQVCDEWLVFSKFRQWMETQDWEGKQLDKDILFPGNKVYSPETCVFVSHRVNSFVTERNARRGQCVIGVSWLPLKQMFMASCRNEMGKNKNLGYFSTETEAHLAWLAFKLKQAKLLAAEQTDPRVAKALIDRYENYVIEQGKVA